MPGVTVDLQQQSWEQSGFSASPESTFLASFLVLFVPLSNFWQWSQCRLSGLFRQHFFLPSASALYSFLDLAKTKRKKQKHWKTSVCVWRWNHFLLSAHSCFVEINICLNSLSYYAITKLPVSSSHVTTVRQMLRIHLIQSGGCTKTFHCIWCRKIFS